MTDREIVKKYMEAEAPSCIKECGGDRMAARHYLVGDANSDCNVELDNDILWEIAREVIPA